MPTFVADWWPGSQWKVPVAPLAVKTGFKWTVPSYFDVDSRGIGFSSFFLRPAKLGAGSFYLGANFDGGSQPLRGENNYRLHVSANVPVSQFWAVTIYNSETSALFLDLTRPTLNSLNKEMRKNADGSVDIYFGPKAPAGHEFELDCNARWKELDPMVSLLWAGEGPLRQELEDAGHRANKVTRARTPNYPMSAFGTEPTTPARVEMSAFEGKAVILQRKNRPIPDIGRVKRVGQRRATSRPSKFNNAGCGDQGELPAVPSTAKVRYFAYFSPTRRTCTYSGSFRHACSASMLGYT